MRIATPLLVTLVGSLGLACNPRGDHAPGHGDHKDDAKASAHSGAPPKASKPKAKDGAKPADDKPLIAAADPKIDYPAPYDGKPVATQTLDGGLLLEDFVVGSGDAAAKGSEVSVHYTGYLLDGTVFDSSIPRNRSFDFTLGQGRVIKAWDRGVVGMKVGGKRRLTAPAELAYGSRRAGKIPPNSTLVFTIELLAIKPPLPPPQDEKAYSGKPVKTEKRDNGLEIYDYKIGEGKAADDGNTLTVHYTGKLDDGTIFDSSVPRKRAFTFPLGRGRVIKGWDQGMKGMKVGGLRKLVIPADLAYGARARGKIPANARLTFTVECMRID